MTRKAAASGDLGAALQEIAHRYRLQEVYAFGSRAGEVYARVRGGGRVGAASGLRGGSDVDIGVRPVPGTRMTLEEKVRLALELEDLLEASRVDLVVVPEVGAFLALEVIRGELLYCRDPVAHAEYELYVLRRAGDLAPFERERRRRLLGMEET